MPAAVANSRGLPLAELAAYAPLRADAVPPFLLATMSGWVNRRRQDAIDHLQVENRVLREHLGGRPRAAAPLPKPQETAGCALARDGQR